MGTLVLIGLTVLALWARHASAQTCSTNTEQVCLNRNNNATVCLYDFPNHQCVEVGEVSDACQSNNDQNSCTTDGCFWDSYIKNCLASLSQVNSAFQCSFWTAFSTSAGNQNTACQFHGCQWDVNAHHCVAANETLTPAAPNIITSVVRFVNDTVNTETQALNVAALVPFVYSEQTPTNPKFPMIQVLFSASDLGPFSTVDAPGCSTYQSSAAVAPAAFTTTVDPVEVNAFLMEWVNQYHNLDFNTSEIGLVLQKSLGRPNIGPSSIVKSVSYDGAQFRFNVSIDLINATVQCNTRGASKTEGLDSRIYIVPLSYIESSPSAVYAQTTKTFTVAVPITGSVTIGGNTAYGTAAFPLTFTFKSGDHAECDPGEGRMYTGWQVETYNVYDVGRTVSVVTGTDVVFRSPVSPAGPVNCYGEEFFWGGDTPYAYSCDASTFTCKTTFVTRTACRVFTEDGNAFTKCSYAKDADRIADMGSDIPYPTTLDTLHTIFFYRRNCGPFDFDVSSCPIYTTSGDGHPDTVSAHVSGSAFPDTTQTSPQFVVSTGFLPGQNQGLGAGVDATAGSIQLQADGLITLFASLGVVTRNRYILEVVLSNTIITPLDSAGGPMTSVPGYTGPAQLTYYEFRTSLLYSAKFDFDQGCGAAGTCQTLPACEGIVGCDGFSLPVAQLQALMPSPRYSIVLAYEIDLPTDSNPPTRRRLLSYLGDSADQRSIGPAGRRLLQTSQSNTFRGTATFNIIIVGSSIVVVNSTYPNATAVTVDFVGTINQADLGKTRHALLVGVVTSVLATLFVYASFSHFAKSMNTSAK